MSTPRDRNPINDSALDVAIQKRIKAISSLLAEATSTEPGLPKTTQPASVPPPNQIEELVDLLTLAELRGKFVRRVRRKRWPLVAGVLGVIAAAGVLVFTPTHSTDIELDAAVSEVTFTLPFKEGLFNQLRMSELGLTGARSVSLPASDRVVPELVTGDKALSADLVAIDPSVGEISINRLIAPAGSRVTVVLTTSNRWSITLECPSAPLEFETSVRGPINFRVSGGNLIKPIDEMRTFEHDRTVTVEGAPRITLELVSLRERDLKLRSQLQVSGLTLQTVEQYRDNGDDLPRVVSTILSGNVFLESMNGRPMALRSGQDLKFSKSDGDLRTLETHGDQFELKQSDSGSPEFGHVSPVLALQFHGKVQGMKFGTPDNLRSIMPSLLEWLYARQTLALFIGANLTVFSLLAGFLKWLEDI